jgi:hypothetical protein
MSRSAAATLAGLAIVLASACSDDGGAPSLSVSPASITVNASSEAVSVNEVFLQITVARMPRGGVWVDVESDGDAVHLAEFVNAEGNTAELNVVLKSPVDVGSGEYSSTVTLSVCRDEACTHHIKNSPFAIPVVLNVTDPPDAAPLVDRHALEHDVVDAEYSEALDAIVMVSASPTPALHLYDPVAQTAQSIALDEAPQAVSVGPDGLSAAVGHDGMITVVDLANIADPIVSPKTVLDLSTDVGDIVLAGNGYVHALPRTVNGIRSVEIATNTETAQGHPATSDGTKARLHPGDAKMYGANNGLTPDNIERYDIAAGVAASKYSSPYGNIHDMCGALWMHEGGLHIYTACGNVFRAGEDANRTIHVDRRDMLYAGTLGIPGADNTFGGRRIRSLSHSAESHEIALLDEVAPTCDLNPLVCSTLRLYDSDYLDPVAQYRLLPVKIGGVNHRQRGLFVFHSADGAARYLVSKLVPAGGYLVSTLGVPAHEPDLSPPPAPVVTASVEAGITAAPLEDFEALPHDVVDAAFSAALNAIVMVSAYPTSAVHVHDLGTGANRSIALTKLPSSLSLGPDGLSASVAHDGLVTIVDLAPGGAAPALLPTATPGSTVLGDGHVYVMPSTNARIRSIHIATGVETQGSAPITIGAYTTARLHPAGSKMYGFDTLRDELTSFPIVLGIADYGAHSPYLPNEHPMCGDQWFSESGALIYTACGNTFDASDTPAEDMLFAGTLELTDAENVFYRVDSLSDSAEAQEVALIEYTRPECTPGQSFFGEPCSSHLNLYDNASLAREARTSFSPLAIGARTYPQQGRFVFHSADGTQRYVISQLLEMPNPETEFYISRLP